MERARGAAERGGGGCKICCRNGVADECGRPWTRERDFIDLFSTLEEGGGRTLAHHA